MAVMTSLVFRTLDQQVVSGLADHPAVRDERGTLSYAQLLHDSASLAGGLREMGVTAGSAVALELPVVRDRVVAVLACARLGAEPGSHGPFRVTGTPPMVQTPETEVPWDVVIRAGRTDPAVAPDRDPEGYEERVLASYAEMFATLGAGQPVT
jgi:acyl-CoA synthetase (AMP-forming)/AMP-acid ligase II